MNFFDRNILEKALARLGDLANQEGITLDICIYGGALMLLAYNSRVATKDVDAVFAPREAAIRIAAQVAEEMELPENWLNDQVKMFLAPSEKLRKLPLQFKGLQLTSPTAGYLLAMKALACRPSLPGYEGDLGDLKFLIRKLEIQHVEEIQEKINDYYPDDVLLPHHRLILENLIEELWG